MQASSEVINSRALSWASPKQLLTTAGVLSFGLAIFQAAVTLVPEWARYFGAWEFVLSKLWLLYLTGFIASILFAVCGFYAISGAGYIRRLPLLGTGLILISSVIILRGLAVVLIVLIYIGVIQTRSPVPLREFFASLIALSIGVIYLVGTIRSWSKFRVK